MKVIEVTVSPKGETTVQTKGYAGAECVSASKFVEEALGLAVNERKTAEYFGAYETQQQTIQQ
jgi:hypothetical protein